MTVLAEKWAGRFVQQASQSSRPSQRQQQQQQQQQQQNKINTARSSSEESSDGLPVYHRLATSSFSSGPIDAAPKGREVVLNDVTCYIAGDRHSDQVVIVLSDLFGYGFRNTRAICDRFAESGLFVVLPDLFGGDTLDFSLPSASALYHDWCGRHGKESTLPIVSKVLDYVEFKLRPRNGCLAVGYCFGGRYAVLVNAAGRVRCSVVSCPSFLEAEEIAEIQTPTLWLCADTDRTFKEEDKAAAQKSLSGKFFESQFVTYPATEHGFCTRFHASKKGSAAASRDALVRTIGFLKDAVAD